MVTEKARMTSVDAAEVERFSRHAADWWNPRGPMAALHKFNPVRLAYIRDQAAACFGRDPKKLDCLKGLRMLDIGCGGGILSEPLARLGAAMVGADPSEDNIAAAKTHASEADVAVDYRATTAEDLSAANERFDVVLAMEVVEHVADVEAFVDGLRGNGKTRRPDDRSNAQPDTEELCACHRRRRIRVALAAARHASMGQVRQARRAGARD